MEGDLNDLRKQIEALRAELASMREDGGSFISKDGKPISLRDVNTMLEKLRVEVSKLEGTVDAVRIASKL